MAPARPSIFEKWECWSVALIHVTCTWLKSYVKTDNTFSYHRLKVVINRSLNYSIFRVILIM